MLSVDAIRADYSPLRLLVNKELDWAEMEGPRVSARFDAAGTATSARFRG